MKNILSLLLLLHLSLPKCAAEVWRHLEGLPCEETTSIIQDVNGFLWFGTRLGLVRYDGYRLKNFRNDMCRPHAFSSCDIKSLAADGEGNVYAGAFFGLNVVDTHNQCIQKVHFAKDDFVRSLLYDREKRLWVGTSKGLYCRLPEGTVSFVEHVPKDQIVQIKEDNDHYLYVVTENHGLYLCSPDAKWRNVPGTETLQVRSFVLDDAGEMWLGTNRRGLFRLENVKQGQDCNLYYEGADCYVINALLTSPVNGNETGVNLLLATDRGCFQMSVDKHHADRKGKQKMSSISSLSDKNVLALFEDRNGNLWASTEGDGLWFLKNHKQPFDVERCGFTKQIMPIMSQFDVRQLKDTALWKEIHYTNALYEDARGVTWVGTWNDGLYVIQDGQIRNHLSDGNTSWLRRNDIYAFATLGSGRMIFSSWEGLYFYDYEKNSGEFLESIGQTRVNSMHTLSICQGGDSHLGVSSFINDLWLGLVGGIAHIWLDEKNLQESTVTLYTHVNVGGIRNPEDVGALTDLTTGEGDYQIGGIYRIVQDRLGRIWACTSEPGLLLYDEDADCFRSVSKEMGVHGDNVHSLDIDAQGNMWMTTNYGILKMRMTEVGEVRHHQLYTVRDGLPVNYFGSAMSTLLNDGRVAFLSPNHLVVASSASASPQSDSVSGVSHQETELQACISDIWVGNEPLADESTEWDALPPYVSHITLNHRQNHLSFSFSTLSIGDEASVRYTYQLEGVDAELQQTEIGDNTVHYSQLQPGTYELHYGVTGISTKEQVLIVEVLQPLWWRWWARLIYLCLLLVMVLFVAHFVIERNRKNHQIELLAVEKQALDEQYRSKMQFYTRIIHEFLTPVTLISELSHELQNKVRPSLQATLFMLSSQIDKLHEAMSHVVEVREGDNSLQEALQKAQEMTQTDRDFLRRCTESVNAHIADEDYSHQVMMQEVGASHATLYRKLKALTGLDATTFIRSIRMKSACQILSAEPNIRISELALRVGFSNPKYFSSCFKAEFGITPKEYVSQEC